jgi:hypothetical protein
MEELLTGRSARLNGASLRAASEALPLRRSSGKPSPCASTEQPKCTLVVSQETARKARKLARSPRGRRIEPPRHKERHPGACWEPDWTPAFAARRWDKYTVVGVGPCAYPWRIPARRRSLLWVPWGSAPIYIPRPRMPGTFPNRMILKGTERPHESFAQRGLDRRFSEACSGKTNEERPRMSNDS